MMDFNINALVPRFIRKDKNGYALTRAIEAGMKDFLAVAQLGLDTVSNVDAMPEWRLDELAWEYNILYDYSADVETKRGWIRNAAQSYSLYGTPAGVAQYLRAAFSSVDVEEAWEYGGDPFHFRVVVTGEWSTENDEWAKKAIEATKNVRSVLDNIIFNSGSVTATLNVAAAVCGVLIEDEVRML